jgi:hypothetical protein
MHGHLLGDCPSFWGTNHIRGVYVLNDQLTSLGACLADEIMSTTRIKQNDYGVSVWRKRTHEDLLTLWNVLHSGVVDVARLGNSNLLLTTWWMTDVAHSSVLLWS